MRACLLLCTLFCLSAAEPNAKQKAVVDQLCASAIASEVVWDDQGNVIKLALSNHDGTPRGKAGNVGAPGVSSELFGRIVELPHLQAIALEKQPLGDADYALLGQLKQLRDVRLQYMDKAYGASARAALFINELPLPLEVLELKHCFRIDGDIMAELKAQPDLIKVELDTNFARPSAVGFLKQSPKIENLQLHRTSMSGSDLTQVIQALPQLRVLEVRPNQGPKDDPITGATLSALAGHQHIEGIFGSLDWKGMPWENGVSVLAKVPSLRVFSIDAGGVDGWGFDHPTVQALHQARPDLRIEIKYKPLGGENTLKVDKDEAWNWDKGVNTHG